MIARIVFAVVTLFFMVGSISTAADLSGTVTLIQQSIPTIDPNTLGPGPDIDLYQVALANPNTQDVTSLQLSLPGTYINNNTVVPFTFSESSSLPVLGVTNFVGETFFVIPPGSSVLDTSTTDDNTLLASAFTLVGSTPLVPALGSAVIATLSVPAGQSIDITSFTGTVLPGSFGDESWTLLIPEPSSALLCGLASLFLRARRKRS